LIGTFVHHLFYQPIFQVDVELCVPSVTINPNLDDIQSAIDNCAVQIIKSTQQIESWKSITAFANVDKQEMSNEWSMNHQRTSSATISFYERIANDIEMVKNVLILTGAVQSLRRRVCAFVLLN
jgi:dynein heavy chain